MGALHAWFSDLNPLLQALGLVPILLLYWALPLVAAAICRRIPALREDGFTGARWLAPRDPAVAIRQTIGLAASAMLYWYLGGRKIDLAGLLLLGVITFGLATFIARAEGSRRAAWLVFSLTLTLGWLVAFKYLQLVADSFSLLLTSVGRGPFSLPELLTPLGISYYVFRIIAYLVETHWEEAPPLTLLGYLHYLAFFPSILAGPIERPGPFHEQGEQARFSLEDQSAGFHRIVVGVAKKVLLADLVGGLIFGWSKAHPQAPAWFGIVLFYGYWLRLYWDFSGYSDIAIGAARLFGYRTQENFDRPYLAANIQQFWQRWHMSLSFWIRDYVYYPIVTLRFGRRWGVRWTYFTIIVSMALCGIWHGAQWTFLWWGIYHGVGLAVCAAYQDFIRRRFAQSTWLKHPVVRVAGSALTLTFVTAGLWLFFDTGWPTPRAWLLGTFTGSAGH
jgi:alginate O-acetyltransferase complex protein AlgI